MKPMIIAHRGASGYCPENTLAAFEKAIELKVDGIETDVQMSKEGQLVLIHDETLNRTTSGQGWVGNTTYMEMKKLDAGSWFNPLYSNQHIPTLEELIALVKPHSLLLNLELKNDKMSYQGLEEKVIELVIAHNMMERVIISSFNHVSLKKCKKLNANVSTALLFSKRVKNIWEYAKEINVDSLHPRHNLVTEKFISQSKIRQFKVFPWTVNTKSTINRMIRLRSDGLITNFPDRI